MWDECNDGAALVDSEWVWHILFGEIQGAGDRAAIKPYSLGGLHVMPAGLNRFELTSQGVVTMAKLPASFDWKNSPAHLDLLSKFVKARNTAQVLDWQYLKGTIGENTKDAIDRFIRDRALIPGELEEALDRVFTASQLKKMLKERSLKQSGSKEELIERLVDADRPTMEKAISQLIIMKCSPNALTLVDAYEEEKQRQLDLAKQQSHIALLNNNPKEAYKIFVSYSRRYTSPEFSSTAYAVDRLESILSSHPKVLGSITPSALRGLQAAVCIAKLWYGESAVNWLPDGFTTSLKSNQVAVNYLTRHAELKHAVTAYGEYAKTLTIVFDANDIDSCDLCLVLNGKEFARNESLCVYNGLDTNCP